MRGVSLLNYRGCEPVEVNESCEPVEAFEDSEAVEVLEGCEPVEVVEECEGYTDVMTFENCHITSPVHYE